MKFFSVDDVELIHMQIIDASGGSQGTRDRRRLESVVASQTQIVFGKELYDNVFKKAAALCWGIIGDHPFTDGNKRTGLITALIFLEQNNVPTSLSDQDLEDFAVQIAVEHLSINDIAHWLKSHTA